MASNEPRGREFETRLPRLLSIFTVRSVAERGIAVHCLSVLPSVRPSVTLVDCDHTRRNSSKIYHG